MYCTLPQKIATYEATHKGTGKVFSIQATHYSKAWKALREILMARSTKSIELRLPSYSMIRINGEK
ncbi:hypothetical protein N9878_01740 [bacterium]|nr:hypothetical protein [bacterium]